MRRKQKPAQFDKKTGINNCKLINLIFRMKRVNNIIKRNARSIIEREYLECMNEIALLYLTGLQNRKQM